MKIVVLCGGLSPERDVSISTGTKMAAALRSLGHKVILTDMYFGLENYAGGLENIFDVYTGEGQTAISEIAPDLGAVRKSWKKGGKSQFGVRTSTVETMRFVRSLSMQTALERNPAPV